MNDKVSPRQEVDIKELLYGVLKSWRPIVGLGLGCAVLLGGYRASQSVAGQMDEEYAREQQEQCFHRGRGWGGWDFLFVFK